MSKEYHNKTEKSDPIDKHVGSKLRAIRTSRGYSQQEVGDSQGLTFQQIQKYERGDNRISASKLHGLAFYLGATIEDFFVDMPTSIEGAGKTVHHEKDGEMLDAEASTRINLEIIRLLQKIDSVALKEKFHFLLVALSKLPIE